MKKLFVTILMLAMLALPGAAWAASVPVYLEGERVATGLERGGNTYLPLRTMFETVGVQVEWDEAEQKITADLPDGGVLTMKIGSEYAELVRREDKASAPDVIEHSVEQSRYTLEQRPFVSGGLTYVPLRFITETVLGYELDWREGAVWLNSPGLTYKSVEGGVYVLNLADGSLRKDGQTLGRLDLPADAGLVQYHQPGAFKVATTPAGNYLLTIDGIGSGALTFEYKLTAFIPAAGGNSATCLVRSYTNTFPEPFWQDNILWLPDDNGSVSIQDATGEISRYEGEANGLCWWTDGRFKLLGSGFDFDLFDSQKQTRVDLSAELITPEVKAEVNAFLRSVDSTPQTDEWLEQYYWGYLGHTLPSADPHPNLFFDREDNGALYFNLSCAYWLPDGSQITHKVYPLVYQLPVN